MASKVDLVGIEQTIIGYLNDNNTSAGAPILNLSQSMTAQVNKVVQYNPSLISPQASYYPVVAVYVEDKRIDLTKGTIAKDQLTGRRYAELTIKLIGAVWNTNIVSDTSDPAAKDVRHLMENVEYILRGYPTLGNTVKNQYPTDIIYHDVNLGENVHLRVGVLNVKASVDY